MSYYDDISEIRRAILTAQENKDSISDLERGCCKSAEFEDHADTHHLLGQLPSDEELIQTYGVRDAKCLESAGILTLCMAAAGLLIAGAVLIEML